jgi:hypothetical protein
MIALRGGFDPAMSNSNPISTEIKKSVDLLALFTKIELLDAPAFPSHEVWRNHVENACCASDSTKRLS